LLTACLVACEIAEYDKFKFALKYFSVAVRRILGVHKHNITSSLSHQIFTIIGSCIHLLCVIACCIVGSPVDSCFGTCLYSWTLQEVTDGKILVGIWVMWVNVKGS
jgi:hypothetical protein